MHFDRLVKCVDEWSASRDRRDVFAQIGPSQYVPRFIKYTKFIAPLEFKQTIIRADLIVAHAGMGSIISAFESGKPIFIMPRRGDFGETRNDHQVATAKRFAAIPSVHVAMDERELTEKLDHLDLLWMQDNEMLSSVNRQWVACPYSHDKMVSTWPNAATNVACPHLLKAVEAFIEEKLPLNAIGL